MTSRQLVSSRKVASVMLGRFKKTTLRDNVEFWLKQSAYNTLSIATYQTSFSLDLSVREFTKVIFATNYEDIINILGPYIEPIAEYRDTLIVEITNVQCIGHPVYLEIRPHQRYIWLLTTNQLEFYTPLLLNKTVATALDEIKQEE